MKNVPAVEAALLDDTAIKAVPEAVIDWNMNRYASATATNPTPADVYDFDIEIFPIESIIEPLRPLKGINKARVGTSTIAEDHLSTNLSKPWARFYMADPDDEYKYWTSPSPSNGSGVITNVKPQVVYSATQNVNKIVLTFENSWASPKTFSIQTTTTAVPADANWTEIANQTTVGNGWKGVGQIVLYWNGTAWVTTGRVDNADKTPKTKALTGVRIVVTALEGGYVPTADGSALASTYAETEDGNYTTYTTTGFDSHFDLIEISARLEVDLSPHVMEVDTDFDMGAVDQLYPLGTITSNQGSVTLSNLYKVGTSWVPGLFNASNAASPYAPYIDANAEINLRYNYFSATGQSLGGVQHARMYADMWSGQADETVQVEMTDYSKFFSETVVRAAMWEGLTVPELAWRILDSVGFSNYRVDRNADRVTEHIIPVFYTDGVQTVWEVLDELAQAAQAAIYIDGTGTLQVKTRDFAFSAHDAPVATLTSETSPGTLANIFSLEQSTDFEPNHYKVIYQKTDWSNYRNGMPVMQKVWEPEDTLVLRGTPLVRTLDTTDTHFYVGANDVKVWPYKGMVNINGELIRYNGKQFIYYTGTNGETRNSMTIESMADYNKRNKDTPVKYRHKNHFTGGLVITEREVWNTEKKRHPVDAEGYSVRGIVNGNHKNGLAGFRHMRQESKVRLNTPSKFKVYKDIMVATRGDTDDQPFFYYGTKMRFRKGAKDAFAGIVIHNSTNSEDGYYIELTLSKNLSGAERKNRNELIVYSRVNGKDKRIGDEALAVGEDIDYEIDVSFAPAGNDHKVKVWFNGKLVFTKSISGADKNASNGKFGMFARGKTVVDFEYLYAIRKQEREPADDFSFMDKVKRGYSGDAYMREWVYRWRYHTRRVKKKTGDPKHRINERFMDDFGPYVHEVREFDVKFDPNPVLHSRLYLTNDWSACVLEYHATPFGAQFVIANTYRANAVLSGEDKLSFSGTNQSVNQILTVFGRALVIDEAEEVIAKNADQIRRRGKVESDLSNKWIQSKEMAQDIADWMNDNFSYGNDFITVEVFGNPLIEVGDVVHVTYPDKHIDDDYFVTNVKNSFSEGLKTNLGLRRRA